MTLNLRSTIGKFSLKPSSSDEKFYSFDIETNGLLNKGSQSVSKMWCMVIQDVATKELFKFTPDNLEDGLNKLKEATALIGHNILFYDVPVIRKLFPAWEFTGQYIDTYVLSCLFYPKETLFALDEAIFPHLQKRDKGSHSLDAWGKRLKNYKQHYNDWSKFTPEMLEYNTQDVVVTTQLYEYLTSPEFTKKELEKSIPLEHDVAQILELQMATGWTFDVDAALDLEKELEEEQLKLEQEIINTIPPEIKEEVFVPKRDNKTRGYKAGVPVIKRKEIPFNPNSRDQCVRFFVEKYGWEPTEFTDNEENPKPKLNDDILATMPYPEAKPLGRYMMLQKYRGQISSGKNAWLKYVTDECKLHGSIIPNGTVTGRCSHNSPNLAQTPASRNPYGNECRALFSPPPGFLEIGSDAKALELRCLAGYLALYDDGEYIKKVIDPEVDIHVYNQNLFGVDTRDVAKTLIYCFPVECTKVKTENGWKSYDEIELNEGVHTYNMQTGMAEIQKIKSIINPYWDTVYRYRINNDFYFECTPLHRWVVQRHQFKELVPAELLAVGDKLLIDTERTARKSTGKNKLVTINKIQREYLGRRMVFCIGTNNETFVMKQRNCPEMITGNCVVYGGGPRKAGSVIVPYGSVDDQYNAGKKALNRFMRELPAYAELKAKVNEIVEGRGFLRALDGRKLNIRHSYAALNTLLQSAGAVVMKRVGVEIYEKLIAHGLVYDRDMVQLGFIHDEYQHGIAPEYVEDAKRLILESYPAAGRYFDFACPIEGDVKVGKNWAECH